MHQTTPRLPLVLLHPAPAGLWRYGCTMMSGIESLSTTVNWLARYRGSIRYRGLRYRGLVSDVLN